MSVDIESINKVSVEPGDVVVLRVAHKVTGEHLDELSTVLRPMFPDNRILVLDEGDELEVYRVAKA